jgi:ABC-type transporter Mla subunit MlaD
MGRIPETVKIGIIVLVSIAGILGSYQLITGGLKSHAATFGVVVHFRDASGVVKGMDVTAAGSPIGYVDSPPKFDKDLRLTAVKVRINKDVTIYKNSRFIIAQASLLGEKMLTLEDPLPENRTELALEGDVFEGTTEGDMQTIVARADTLLEEVHTLIGPTGVGGTLKDLSATLNISMGKVNGITDRVDTLLADNSLYMTASMKNFQAMSSNMVRLSANLEQASLGVKQLTNDPANREQLNAVMANLNQASSNMTVLTDQLNSLIGDPQVQQDAKDTLRLSKETLEETKKTVQQFQGTLSNMDTTFQNVGALVSGAGGTLGKLNKKLGVKVVTPAPTTTAQPKGGTPAGAVVVRDATRPGLSSDAAGCGKQKGKDTIQTRLTLDLRGVDHNASRRIDRGDRLVADVNGAVGYKGKYLQAGVDNIGDGGDINLLAGLGSLKGASARGGIYRGQFGAGLAWYTKGFGAEVTGYDPLDPKVDAQGYLAVGDSVDIVLGVEDATDRKKVTAGVGVKF